MNRALKASLSVLMLAALLFWIATHDGVGSIADSLARVDSAWLLAGVGVQLLAVVAGVLRWRALLASQRVHTALPFLARHYLIGRFVGVFTPSTLGLDGYRVLAVSKATGRTAASARAILLEKGLAFAALAGTSFLLLPLGAERFYGYAGLLASLGLGVAACAGLYLMHRPYTLRRLALRAPAKARGPLLKLSGALTTDKLGGRTLGLAFGLGALSQVCTAGTFVCTGLALGLDASPAELLVVGHAIVLAMLIPISVAGAGLREGTAVAMLGLVAVSAGDAALVGVLGFLVTQPAALLGGLLQLAPGAAPSAHAATSPAHTPPPTGARPVVARALALLSIR